MSLWADVRSLFSRFAANAWQFLAIHPVVNVLVIVLLAPAAAAFLGAAVTLSGQPALSDEELLFFILSPLGLTLFIVLLSGFSIIVFLEFAALIAAS